MNNNFTEFITLSLTINPDNTKELVKSFSTLKNLRYAYISNNIGTLVISRVPIDIEYEVSTFIFNKIEIYEKTKSNKILQEKIFKGKK